MKELEQFVEWLPKNVKEFEGLSGEKLINVINNLMENDPDQLKDLILEFKSETKKNANGGKIDYLLNKYSRK